jgi:hypothetical protein
MILTSSRQEFETQFASTRLRICFGERMRPACDERVLAIANFSRLCRRKPAFEKSVFRRDAATSTPEACATLLQLAEPAQSDGGLGIVNFVAAVEGADPDPLKSGAFD